MTAHEVGKYGRIKNPIERMGENRKHPNPSGYNAYQGTARSYCFMCQAEHSWDDCPLTPEQRAAVAEQRARRET